MKTSLRKRRRPLPIFDSESDNSTDPEPLSSKKKRYSSKKMNQDMKSDYSEEFGSRSNEKDGSKKRKSKESSAKQKDAKVEFFKEPKDLQEMTLVEVIDTTDKKERKKRKTKQEIEVIKRENEREKEQKKKMAIMSVKSRQSENEKQRD